MTEFIWHWKKGEKKIYTQNIDAAEKAMREGAFVMGVRVIPSEAQDAF